MDLNDFTSAENKKMTTENDIPTFNPPKVMHQRWELMVRARRRRLLHPLRHPTWIRDATTTRKRGW